jgi:hypothetical protein
MLDNIFHISGALLVIATIVICSCLAASIMYQLFQLAGGGI